MDPDPQAPSWDEEIITTLTARLSGDRTRVRFVIGLVDVNTRTTLELAILDRNQNVITSSAILGVMTGHFEFTLHLPTGAPTDLKAGAILITGDAIEISRKIVQVVQ